MADPIRPQPGSTPADEPFAADDLNFEMVADALDASWFGRYKPQFYYRAFDNEPEPGELSGVLYLRPHFQIETEPTEIAAAITLLTTNLRGNLDIDVALPHLELEPDQSAVGRWAGSWHTIFTSKDPEGNAPPASPFAPGDGGASDLRADIIADMTDGQNDGGRHTPFFGNYRPQFYFRSTEGTDGDLVFGDTLTVSFEDAPNPAIAIAIFAPTGGLPDDEDLLTATLFLDFDESSGPRASGDVTLKGQKVYQNSQTSEVVDEISYVSIAELRDELDFFL